MREKLLDQWYSICRDAARQRIVIIGLAVVSALLYLVSALSLASDTSPNCQTVSQKLGVGFRAVGVDSVGPVPKLNVGDLVDVIIDSTVVLEQAKVFDIINDSSRSETVVIAVPLAETPTIATAASLGAITLVLAG